MTLIYFTSINSFLFLRVPGTFFILLPGRQCGTSCLVCVCGVRFHILKSSTHTHTHKTCHAHNNRPTFGLSFCPKNVTGCRFQPFLLLQLYRIVLPTPSPPLSHSLRSQTVLVTHTLSRSLAYFFAIFLLVPFLFWCFDSNCSWHAHNGNWEISLLLQFAPSRFLSLSPLFLPCCRLPTWLSRDWFSSWVSPVFFVYSFNSSFARYFIAFEIASIFFHLLHLTLV